MPSPIRVLLVDDTPELILSTRRRLQALGYDVDTAANGRLALEAMHAHRPDAVILDVMMPELNGFQVCRRIRQEPTFRDVRVILLTAKATPADRFWGEQAGADAYLAKPVDPAELVGTLGRLTGGPTTWTGGRPPA